MNEIFPKYYNSFKCINKNCKHSCCIGWEIDIDDESFEKYKAINSDCKEKLMSVISTSSVPHFILDENERCPFLRKDGLCDMIINMGEDYLCEICKNHPRFFNEYESFCEAGLGICCESACELIIKTTEKFVIAYPDNPSNNEKYFLDIRNSVFEIIQNRDISYDNRINVLEKRFNEKFTNFNKNKICNLYLSLEILDNNWRTTIKEFKTNNIKKHKVDDIYLEQLLVYFIYRNLYECFFEGDFINKIKFCVHATELIRSIYEYGNNPDIDAFLDIARMYSSEIEYSDENPNIIMNSLTK